MASSEGAIGIVVLQGCRCRCGHEWLPRDKTEKPRVCPHCKSAYWDRPKQAAQKPARKRKESGAG